MEKVRVKVRVKSREELLRLGDLSNMSEKLLSTAGKVFSGIILENGFFQNDEFEISSIFFDILEDSKNILNGTVDNLEQFEKDEVSPPIDTLDVLDEAPLETQVGGDRYKSMQIQPIEFIHKNNLGFIQGNIIKYTCRYKAKNGKEDLLKARHYLDLLIKLEYEK